MWLYWIWRTERNKARNMFRFLLNIFSFRFADHKFFGSLCRFISPQQIFRFRSAGSWFEPRNFYSSKHTKRNTCFAHLWSTLNVWWKKNIWPSDTSFVLGHLFYHFPHFSQNVNFAEIFTYRPIGRPNDRNVLGMKLNILKYIQSNFGVLIINTKNICFWLQESPPPHTHTDPSQRGLVTPERSTQGGCPQTRTGNTVRSTVKVRTQWGKMRADSKDRRYGWCEERYKGASNEVFVRIKQAIISYNRRSRIHAVLLLNKLISYTRNFDQIVCPVRGRVLRKQGRTYMEKIPYREKFKKSPPPPKELTRGSENFAQNVGPWAM